MYRQYENPRYLEDRLAELKTIERRANEEHKYDLQMEIAELEDRIRFAYEDEEYD